MCAVHVFCHGKHDQIVEAGYIAPSLRQFSFLPNFSLWFRCELAAREIQEWVYPDGRGITPQWQVGVASGAPSKLRLRIGSSAHKVRARPAARFAALG